MGSIYQAAPDPWMGVYCKRCGRPADCCRHPTHIHAPLHPTHAARIRARYALGKAFSPSHDTNDYFTEDPL